MAETQEDKTTDVKALYKEPPSKQSNTSFWWHLVLLFPFSSLCQRMSPHPSHKYWLLLLPLAVCYILLARHVSSSAIPNVGYPFFLKTCTSQVSIRL